MFVAGNQLKNLSISDVLPWIPAMVLYLGSIYSGSKALSCTSVPVFLLSHGASDVIVLLCDSHLPSGPVHLSVPLKLSGFMMGLWSIHYDASLQDLSWIMAHMIISGTYRAVTYWYTTPMWPYSALSSIQRQCLNNFLACAILLPAALILGHHRNAQSNFSHLTHFNFYIGCVFCGILAWATSHVWNKIAPASRTSTSQMTQAAAKILTLLMSMQLFAVNHSLLLWCSITLTIAGDILHVLGNMYEESSDLQHEVSDVLIGT